MKKQYLVARLEKKDGKSVFVASDETLDRSREVVPMDSWDLVNYFKNPVLLVDHDYKVENIVGMATNISTDGGRLTFEPLLHGITPLSQYVSKMIDEGFLNSVSVGFIPHSPETDGGKVSNELLEISFVPVGANPNALRLNSMKSMVLDEAQKKKIEQWLTKQNETLEMQRIEFSKSVFKDEETAKAWLVENSYTLNDFKETDKSFVSKYFEEDKCAEGSQKEIEIEDGVKIFACRTGVRSTPAGQVKEITDKILTEVKEGRILSGRNRKQIEDAVSLLKQTSEALSTLLEMTEPKKDAGESREPKVVAPPSKSAHKADSKVRRALQDMNRISNEVLRQLKQ